ncbi:MAG: hypothetical protein Q4G33_07160 [bacterium]|nr:hypothetical protein [bacterium]
MKLNKKVFSVAIAAAMSLSSVAAFAASYPTAGIVGYDGARPATDVEAGVTNLTVPVPVYNGDPAATSAQAQALYDQGMYFEAHVAASSIPDAALDVFQQRVKANFLEMVEDAIDRVIIEEAFSDVAEFMSNNYYAEASDILINDVYNLALGHATASAITVGGPHGVSSEQLYSADSFTLDDWNRARKLEAEIGAVLGEIVNSKDAAIRRVQFMYGDSIPAAAWYDVVEVGTRYDVYVHIVMPDGSVAEIGEVDIAKNGAVLVDTMPYPRDSVWENPIEG